MNVLDLFSGIGGFSLGLERAGMRTVAFCEIDPYARAVLAKHWPGIPCYDDVRSLTADRLRADGIIPDVICGGFPCQDISIAGSGVGLEGSRSGLWHEYARLIEEIGPQYVIIENVSALRGRGLETVLGKIAALGFDAEWHCLPASAVGAPHRRDRIWIVAYARRECGTGRREARDLAGAARAGEADREERQRDGNAADDRGPTLADAGGAGLAPSEQEIVLAARWREERRTASQRSWWGAEPDVGRVANGIPSRVDRLKCLGNAVVPQIPEIIGRAILQTEAGRLAA